MFCGEIDGNVYRIDEFEDHSGWPSSGTCAGEALTIAFPNAPSGTSQTSFLIGGGFFVEALADSSPSGVQVPAQIAQNGPDSSNPNQWDVAAVVYADEALLFLEDVSG